MGKVDICFEPEYFTCVYHNHFLKVTFNEIFCKLALFLLCSYSMEHQLSILLLVTADSYFGLSALRLLISVSKTQNREMPESSSELLHISLKSKYNYLPLDVQLHYRKCSYLHISANYFLIFIYHSGKMGRQKREIYLLAVFSLNDRLKIRM